jgi:hypothetical protein
MRENQNFFKRIFEFFFSGAGLGPKKKTFFLPSWTLPSRVDCTTKVQPEKIAGYCAEQSNQLIIE